MHLASNATITNRLTVQQVKGNHFCTHTCSLFLCYTAQNFRPCCGNKSSLVFCLSHNQNSTKLAHKNLLSCSSPLSLFHACTHMMCTCTSPHPTPTTQTHKQTHCTIKFIKASSYKSWHKYGAHQTGNHMKKSADKRKKRRT